ncbi:MAG: cytochrome c3 family protein [Phycisphaerales bacterium]
MSGRSDRRLVHGVVRFRAARVVAAGALLSAACAIAASWSGCTVTVDNYKTLSVFFDGVPNPEGAGMVVDPSTGAIRQRVTVSVHKPFAEQQCGECHRGRMRPTRSDGSLCLKCHDKLVAEHEYMHGPVAAAACLWCHDPHESVEPHLLRDVDFKICTQCHTTELLDATKVPEHGDASSSCLKCHVGHGSSQPFMLRSAEGAAPEAAR